MCPAWVQTRCFFNLRCIVLSKVVHVDLNHALLGLACISLLVQNRVLKASLKPLEPQKRVLWTFDQRSEVKLRVDLVVDCLLSFVSHDHIVWLELDLVGLVPIVSRPLLVYSGQNVFYFETAWDKGSWGDWFKSNALVKTFSIEVLSAGRAWGKGAVDFIDFSSSVLNLFVCKCKFFVQVNSLLAKETSSWPENCLFAVWFHTKELGSLSCSECIVGRSIKIGAGWCFLFSNHIKYNE